MKWLAIDCETKDGTLRAIPENFGMGAVVDNDYNTNVFYTAQKMWDFIIQTAITTKKAKGHLYVYAYNHTFDFMLYAPILDKNLVYKDSAIFMVEYNQQEKCIATFLDLQRLYNSSINLDKTRGLKRIGELVGRQKQEYAFTPENLANIEKTKEYCINDAKIVMDALLKLKQKCEELNLPIRSFFTIHQIAIQCAMLHLKKNHPQFLIKDGFRISLPHLQHYELREYRGETKAPYCRGGYVRTFKKGTFENTIKIDINGFWQHCLKEMKIADLKTEIKITNAYEKLHTELFEYHGFAFVALRQPNIGIGFLPIRIGDNNVYPSHECTIIGHYTLKEIQYALSLGCTILKMPYAVLFKEATINPFTDHIEKLYQLRKQSNNEFDNWFYKQMGNSFLGKFSQITPYYHTIHVAPEQVQENIDKGYTIKTTIDRTYVMQKSEGMSDKNYFAPLWYAEAVASSRMKMHEYYSIFGKDKLLYSDTDSIVLKDETFESIRSKIQIGTELGQWKFMSELPETTHITAKKFYAFGHEIHASGIYGDDATLEALKSGTFKRKHILTKKDTTEQSKIGTLTEETIKVDTSDEEIRQIYIDAMISNDDLKLVSDLLQVHNGTTEHN